MKRLLLNQHYFDISKNNPEKLLDDFYIFDEKSFELDKYISNTRDIKNILITIKTLQRKKEKDIVIAKYYNELSKMLGKYSNCSEFSCFVNACDNIVFDAKNDISLLKDIVNKYLVKRSLNETVPEEWIQALLDNNSARKKGKCGEIKLVFILEKNGFREVFTWEDFLNTDFCVVKFSRKFNLNNVRKNLNIKIKREKQNKTLDLIIKAKDRIFLCEAKHLNTSGGGQDKQLSELIEILGLNEKSNVSYVAFLDGKYSNVLLSDKNFGEKLELQRKEIQNSLRKNPYNYWVNTMGFENLVLDMK